MVQYVGGKVGAQQLSDANDATNRYDRQGGLLVSEMNGKYMELALRGKIFMAANQAVQALSLLSSTATGIILNNPNGSGVNIALLHVGVALASAPAGQSNVYLAYGPKSATAITHTAALTVRSGLLEAYSGQGLCDNQSTLPANPVIIRSLGGGPVAASSITPPFISDAVDGAIVIQPGSTLNVAALTTAISAVCSMIWAEIPI